MEESHEHGVLQSAIEQAPCITFGQFRKVARQLEWSLEWLVEQCKADLDRPTDTVRQVFEGVRVEGHWNDMAEVVLPYRCLIDLYRRATRPKPALAKERACACGCGGLVRARRKWVSPACRKRVQRRSRTVKK